jgi:Zn-dependent protease
MDPIMTIVMYIVLIIPSITVHEYAHARASNRLGDTTPRLNNRLTLNPLAHIDRIGTVILPLVLSVMGA